jgi:probable HAF family extracellular repeat protein
VLAGFLGLLPALSQAETPSHACRSITRYSVIELPFIPKVIGPSGAVAGITELHRAVLWHRKSGVEELSVPEGFKFTEPVAITQAGAVLIDAFDAKSHRRGAFAYSNHSLVALTGNQTWARGSGAAGTIVGEWVPEGKTVTDAVYWKNTVPHSLGLCCGGMLKAVNQRGDMVGDAYDDRGHYHAFRWSPESGQRDIDPADSYSSAVAINSAGHILLQVGSEAYLDDTGAAVTSPRGTSPEGTRHLQHLELSGKFYNSVQAMNDCDVVVGAYGPDSEHYRAFLWAPPTGFRDLNSLVPGDSGWHLQSAAAIDNQGAIAGSGELRGDDRGFLLIPQQ